MELSELGAYHVLDKLGAGGMGEVYLAEDTRLGRKVAIKVLPEAFATDVERLGRLRREAQLLAQLSHQNIAQLYGLEEHAGTWFLVMELAPGETLAERIDDIGPLPLTEALPIATQLCAGLAAAHDQGIVHRDLKPANIVVAEDSAGGLRVKILDFGLAKSVAESTSTGLSTSPTEIAATRDGVIQGTAPYMSPEQARGKPADRRTDVWAFGCVLYEMLSARRAFDGETVSDVITAILSAEPDAAALPAGLPPALRRLLRRCLEKDPDLRLRDVGDARLELRDAVGEIGGVAVTDSPRPGRWGAGVALVAMLAAALVGAWAARQWAAAPEQARPVSRLSIALPPGHMLRGAPAISADGRTIAYPAAAARAGASQIYVRALDDAEPRAIAGSEGGEEPSLSADGSQIAFAMNGALWLAAVAGGSPVELASAREPFGSSWISDGEILHSPRLGGGLVRQSLGDGDPVVVTEVGLDRGEYAHGWPQVLPGGQQAIFHVWGNPAARGTSLLQLDDATTRVLAQNQFGFYTTSGVLAVVDFVSNTLRAGRLDLTSDERLAGAVPVLEGFYWSNESGSAWLAFSDTGTLVYARGDPSNRRLVWVDATGQTTLVDADRRISVDPVLSFDGTRIVFREHAEIWVKDLTTGAEQLVVSGDRGRTNQFAPLWSRDDREIIFSSNQSGDWEIYARAADGSGEVRPLLTRPGFQRPEAIGPDGSLVFTEISAATGTDIWLLPLGGEPELLRGTPATEQQPRLSDDGSLLAFTSYQSGAGEIYVQSMAGGDAVQVSADGGFDPVWAADGRTLYYRSEGHVMRATVRPGSPITVLDRGLLFETDNHWDDFGRSFDVAADGRLLMIRPEPGSMPNQLNVILNWFEDLERLLPPAR